MSRVLVVSSLYPPVVRGGYEVECRDAVEHLRSRHEVTVLTSTHHRRRAERDPAVLRLLPFSDATPLGVVRAPWASARGRTVVRDVLDRLQPDLVFLWNGSGLPHDALRELVESGVPVAIRVCQEWIGGLYRDDLHLRYRLPGQRGRHAVWASVVAALDRLPGAPALVRAPALVTVLWNSAHLARTAPPPADLVVVHEEVLPPVTSAADAFASLTPAGLPGLGERVELLVVARIEHLKGIDVAVRAAAELRDRPVRLHVVGDGETAVQAELRALAARLAVDVDFTGALRGPALHALVERAHVWLVPSRTGESAPMVAVEAGLARVPVVAARVGGLPELLREPDEALLFSPDDPADCARAVRAVLADPDGTRRRVEAASRRAADLGTDVYRRHLDHFVERSLMTLTDAQHREPTR